MTTKQNEMVKNYSSDSHTKPIIIVEVGCNTVPGTFKIVSLYAACVATKAPDITNSHHKATSLYPDCRL